MRPFFVVWTGQAASLLGSQLVQFALVWWLTRESGSATALAMATLVALLPQIVIGPFAGALVDRWSRRAIMVAADWMTALATLVLAALFWRGVGQIWHVYLLLLVRATGAAFHWPAMQASTALMVPPKHLARVAGLNQTLTALAGIVVPPLGALAIDALPMQAVLAVDVATAVPAILSLLVVAIPQPARAPAPVAGGRGPSIWTDMRAGLRFVLGWRALMWLALIGVLIHMLGRAAGSLSPLMVTQVFGGGALELGWWQSAAGIGALVGGVVLGVWGGFRRRVVTQMVALLLDGAVIVGLALSPVDLFGLAVVLVGVSGLLEAIAVGLSGAIAQALIPPEVQGRVFALLMSVTQVLAPLGLLVAGPTADALGVQFWWLLTGVVIAAIATAALFVPEVVRVEDAANLAKVADADVR